ncbi:MAG TPA: hypothetical protein VFZ96_10615, partial [Actinomycetota bacterium]|nr:hypothetical protein [Actinomycetota bacterium]
EARGLGEAPRAAGPTHPIPTPSAKRRAQLHGEGHPADAATIVIHGDDAPPTRPSHDPEPASAPAASEAAPRAPEPPGDPNVWGQEGVEGDGEEVDRFSLAREFSQLLQEDHGAADG